ncbi:MAG: hypothetical protein P4M11_09100 [Candidatus Pacebacteria bacterium]|nr:hypothetical protein [Candidatus Paceibacterota bacterium]
MTFNLHSARPPSDKATARWDPMSLSKALTSYDIAKTTVEVKQSSRKVVREKSNMINIMAHVKGSANCSLESRGKSRTLVASSDPHSPVGGTKASPQGKSVCHQANVKVVARIRPFNSLETVLLLG